MSNQIRVTPDQMRAQAKQYVIEADKVNGTIARLDSLLKELQSEWEGDASVAFANRFNELRPGFVKAEELIREISAALNATANTIEQTDEEIAKKYRA